MALVRCTAFTMPAGAAKSAKGARPSRKKSSLTLQPSGTIRSCEGTHSASSSCDSAAPVLLEPLDDGRRRGWCGVGVIPSEFVVPVRIRSRRVIPVWLCKRRWLVLRGGKTPILAVYSKSSESLVLDGDVVESAPLRVMALGLRSRVRAAGEKTLVVMTTRVRHRSDSWVLTFDSGAQRRRVYELIKTWTELGAFLQQLTGVERIARSHNSTVYKCQSRESDGNASSRRRFALKRVHAERCESELAITERVSAIPALRPYIARYLVMFEDTNNAGSVTIVMKYYRGGSLSDRIRELGPVSECVARSILSSLCCALFLLHVNRVLHLDVKAANILFDSGEHHPRSFRNLKLVDFGSGILTDESGEGDDEEKRDSEEDDFESRTLVKRKLKSAGTYGCMAPERFEGRIGPESDVYGAGVVLYHMIVGDVPFTGSDSYQVMARNMQGDVSFSSPRWQQVSAPMRKLARRMLDKDPDSRVTLPEILTMSWLFHEDAPPAVFAGQEAFGAKRAAGSSEKHECAMFA